MWSGKLGPWPPCGYKNETCSGYRAGMSEFRKQRSRTLSITATKNGKVGFFGKFCRLGILGFGFIVFLSESLQHICICIGKILVCALSNRRVLIFLRVLSVCSCSFHTSRIWWAEKLLLS